VSDESTSAKSENPYSTLLTILGAGVALALVIFAIGYVTKSDSGSGGGGGGAAGAVTADISLSEFAIDGNLTVPPGAALKITNNGTMVHNLHVENGPQTKDLQPGDSETLDISSLAVGDYKVFCAIPGHQAAGMEATLKVQEGADVKAQNGAHTGANPDYAKLDSDMINTFKPFVDALTSGVPNTKGIGAQELQPVMDPDGYKRFDITAAITKWETEPGKTVDAWTYNGTVPGPTIHVQAGDKVRVHLINKLPLGTDMHIHGVKLPNDMDGVSPVTQELVPSGGEFNYDFTAEGTAVGMYHPHAHGYSAIPNGMAGALFIDEQTLIPRGKTVSGVTVPADVKPVIDNIMVLNDAGNIGLALNGKSFPGTTAYSMKVGDWGVMHYYNEGLQIHPMHLHQFPQLVFAEDGIALEQPYFVDTLMVAPGERYSVMWQASKPGVWVWHCHILTHAERDAGMFGMVTAVSVS